jgi:hypothetical protein
MINPISVSVTLILLAGILAWLKPNAGRIVLGIFYLAMALAVNVPMALTNPQLYVALGGQSFFPVYRWIFTHLVALNPAVFVLPIAFYQTVMGLLILNKGISVRIGLVGVILFNLAIVPMGVEELPAILLALVEGFLATKGYSHSVYETVAGWFQPRNALPKVP